MENKLRRIGQRKLVENPMETGRQIDFLEYYGTEEIDTARARFVSMYEASRDFRLPYRRDWVRYFLLYMGKSPYYDKLEPWMSAYFLSVAFYVIETLLPRQQAAISDIEPLFVVHPASKDFREAAVDVEQLIDNRIRQTEFPVTHHDVAKQMFMYGTGVFKVLYESEPEYEGPSARFVDLLDFFPHPRGSEPDDMRWTWERDVVHKEKLKELEEQEIISGVDYDALGDGGNEEYISELDKLRLTNYEKNTILNSPETTKDMHELLEGWLSWRDERTGEYFETCVYMIDRSQVVRFKENDYVVPTESERYGKLWIAKKPYVVMRDYRMPGCFYGRGECEIIENQNLQLNDMNNMVMDALHYIVAPVFEAVGGMLEDPDEVVIAPGEIINAHEPNAIRQINMNSNLQAGWMQGDRIKSDIRDITGVTQSARGVEGNIRKTATEVATLVNETMERLKMKAQLNFTQIKKIGRMFFELDHEFTDYEIIAKIVRDSKVSDWKKIKPSDIKFMGEFRINPHLSFGTRTLKFQQMIQLLETVATQPEMMALINKETFLKKLAYNLELTDDDLLVPKDQRVQPEKPQLKLLQGGAGGQEGMPGMAPTSQAPAGFPGAGTPDQEEFAKRMLEKVQSLS